MVLGSRGGQLYLHRPFGHSWLCPSLEKGSRACVRSEFAQNRVSGFWEDRKSLGKIMADDQPNQPHSQSEDQSPQPSTSGYQLNVVDDEIPGPSGEKGGRGRDLGGLASKEEWVQKSGRSV